MLQFRSFVGRLNLVLGLSLCAPSIALAAAKDKSARLLQTEAMQTDYAETNFKKAEQKLKKAIAQCGPSNCSNQVVGELHRDLGTVYIAGLKQTGKGKTEFKQALRANPDLQLDDDFATPEVRKIFKDLGGHEPEPAPEEKPAKEKEKAKEKDEACDPDSGTCLEEEPAKAAESSSSKGSKNWLSLSFDQDLLLYSAQNQVCANGAGGKGAANFSCFQNGAAFRGNIAAGPGNHVSGGLGRATSRLLIGFDRLLGSNVSLGLRLGYAFGGRPSGADKFFTGHLLEAGGRLWFDEGSGKLPVPERACSELRALVGQPLVLGVRPEAVSDKAHARFQTEDNFLRMQVTLVQPLGHKMDVYLATDHHPRAIAQIDSYAEIRRGETLPVFFDMSRVHFFEPGETGKNLVLSAPSRA